jgi:hypothetical protein
VENLWPEIGSLGAAPTCFYMVNKYFIWCYIKIAWKKMIPTFLTCYFPRVARYIRSLSQIIMNLLNSNQPHADLQNVLTLVWCLWKFRATSVSTQSLPGSSLLRVVGYLLLSGGLFVQCFCPGTRQTTALPSVTEKTVGKQTMHGKVQKKKTRGKHPKLANT